MNFLLLTIIHQVFSLQIYVLTDGPQKTDFEKEISDSWSRTKAWLESIFVATGFDSKDDTHFITR
jgi:hypothetical protein